MARRSNCIAHTPAPWHRPAEWCGSRVAQPAFCSTTDDIWTAYTYSGGWDVPASLLEISFDGASRGAAISFLSVFPRERELLLPPFTFLAVQHVETRGNKRFLKCTLNMNPATLDLRIGDDFSAVPYIGVGRQRDSSASFERDLRKHNKELIDHFSGAILHDAVIADDGHVYERAHLERWIAGREAAGLPIISPKTHKPSASLLLPTYQSCSPTGRASYEQRLVESRFRSGQDRSGRRGDLREDPPDARGVERAPGTRRAQTAGRWRAVEAAQACAHPRQASSRLELEGRVVETASEPRHSSYAHQRARTAVPIARPAQDAAPTEPQGLQAADVRRARRREHRQIDSARAHHECARTRATHRHARSCEYRSRSCPDAPLRALVPQCSRSFRVPTVCALAYPSRSSSGVRRRPRRLRYRSSACQTCSP